MNQPACPLCHGTNIGPPNNIRATDCAMYVAGERKPVFASVARVCLDCGYLMQFLPPDDLARLRNRLSSPR
ncbi:MAG: hypothetical protein WCP28_20915 [Actinomycetes bacterium]